MRHASRWLLSAVVALTTLTVSPAQSLARGTRVEWKSVDVPAGERQKERARFLRNMLTKAAKKADFGKAKSVVLSARVVEFTSATRGDVHRVSCTLVGRVVGGPTARSRISFGGRPSERLELEKQVLTMVANGVVGRLASIVRARAEARDAEARDADAEARNTGTEVRDAEAHGARTEVRDADAEAHDARAEARDAGIEMLDSGIEVDD